MKRIISIFLLILMLCSAIPFACLAEEGVAPRASDYFTSYGVNLAYQSDGRIKIVFNAVGSQICTQIGVASYEIEEKNSNGNWEDFSGLLSGRTGSGVQSYTFSKYFTPNEGKKYRVTCTFTCVIDGMGGETKNYTSGTI